jgi:hypothetical protein
MEATMTQTTQSKIKSLLEKSGIHAKEIRVYGSQIMITCLSQNTAKKWADLCGKFATVKAVFESVDENKKVTATSGKYHKVWRVAACI